MAQRKIPDVRAHMVTRIKKLVDEANARGMDGIAALLNVTMEVIDKGGPELLEFAVLMRRSWELQRQGSGQATPYLAASGPISPPTTPPGIVSSPGIVSFPRRPGEPE